MEKYGHGYTMDLVISQFFPVMNKRSDFKMLHVLSLYTHVPIAS